MDAEKNGEKAYFNSQQHWVLTLEDRVLYILRS